MLDLYKKIILKHSYFELKNILKNKGSGSGLGTIFKLLVVDNLTPEIGPVNKFNNFSISEKYEINTFIKKDNDHKLKLLLKNKTYLIEQEQKHLNDKDLDLLIIDIKDNDIYIYGFQISVYIDKIFEISYIKKLFSNMLNNLNDIFGIDIFKNKFLYFGYIFDYSNIYDYHKILIDCKNIGWKYCFFDTNKKIFCTKQNIEIHDINEIVTNVILDDKLNIYENTIINNDYLYIIKDLISKEKGKNINNLKYIGEKEGPIIEGNIINVLVMSQNIEMIFKKDNILVGEIFYWFLK